MEDDIEKLIESFVVPEMEYVKPKRSSEKTVDVPEVVLPKTRAEEYNEAKGRLRQKTSAASHTYDKAFVTKSRERAAERTVTQPGKQPRKTAEPEEPVVTEVILPEIAATTEPVAQTTKEKTQRTIERISGLRRIVDAPKWVGDNNDLVPFSWRMPLVEVAKPSRLYKLTMREAKERALLLPVPRQ